MNFTTTAWHVIDAIIAVVSGAIAGGLVTRFIVEPYKSGTQERLAHVESDLAVERDERKALRERVDARDARRFDLLHEWRAKAMLETYARLCELEDAYEAFSRSFGGFVGGPTPKKFWEDLATAGTEFRNAFWTKRVLFGKSLADDLMMLNRGYVEISNLYFMQYRTGVAAIIDSKRTEDAIRTVEYDALMSVYQSTRYREANDRIDSVRMKIEERFRDLFGVTEDE
jgi:hypothetical protein